MAYVTVLVLLASIVAAGAYYTKRTVEGLGFPLTGDEFDDEDDLGI